MSASDEWSLPVQNSSCSHLWVVTLVVLTRGPVAALSFWWVKG